MNIKKLPLHKGGSLLPDSSPERCNTLYLAGKEREKEYEQNARTPFFVRLNLLYGRLHFAALFFSLNIKKYLH